jgi:secreted trypsin-like serine protease
MRNDLKWKVLIAVGRHNITAPAHKDTIYANTYKVKYCIVHSEYNYETNANDIALVKTDTYIKFKLELLKCFSFHSLLNDFIFSRGVGPACLPFAYQDFVIQSGTILTAIGFGNTQFALSASADKSSWILKKVQLKVNNTLGVCKTDATRVCALGTYNNSSKVIGDSCQRDSGSGLYGYMNNRYYIFAIIRYLCMIKC